MDRHPPGPLMRPGPCIRTTMEQGRARAYSTGPSLGIQGIQAQKGQLSVHDSVPCPGPAHAVQVKVQLKGFDRSRLPQPLVPQPSLSLPPPLPLQPPLSLPPPLPLQPSLLLSTQLRGRR